MSLDVPTGNVNTFPSLLEHPTQDMKVFCSIHKNPYMLRVGPGSTILTWLNDLKLFGLMHTGSPPHGPRF
jgi:hypothetical protein